MLQHSLGVLFVGDRLWLTFSGIGMPRVGDDDDDVFLRGRETAAWSG